jgi:hypothetical protein
VSDVKRSSRPPVCEKLPGLSDQTGGRRIPIRARIGLRSGKMGNRGTYRARIGDGVDREKRGSGRGCFGEVYGVKRALDLQGISENFKFF